MDACCSISPELWNFTAVLIAAALTLWSCRFFCFLIEYVDLHAADRREAVRIFFHHTVLLKPQHFFFCSFFIGDMSQGSGSKVHLTS
jgi:hypothetical protein